MRGGTRVQGGSNLACDAVASKSKKSVPALRGVSSDFHTIACVMQGPVLGCARNRNDLTRLFCAGRWYRVTQETNVRVAGGEGVIGGDLSRSAVVCLRRFEQKRKSVN